MKRNNQNTFPNSLDSADFFPSKLDPCGKRKQEIIIKSMYCYWKMGWKLTRLNSPLAQVASCTRPDETNRKAKIKTWSIMPGIVTKAK